MIGELIAQADFATGLEPRLERTLDLVGVFVFAISGGLLAVRKQYELVGVTALALVTALGGGVMRDVVLGATPPTAFGDVWYLAVPLLAAGVVFVGHALIDQRLNQAVLVFDAVGLGLFCVTGAVKASALGASAVGAVFIGVIAAVGGGIVRDVLANEQPSLFQRDSTLYAIPAAAGATAVVVAIRNDFYSGAFAASVAVAVLLVRLAAMRFKWRAPTQPAQTSSCASCGPDCGSASAGSTGGRASAKARIETRSSPNAAETCWKPVSTDFPVRIRTTVP